MPVTQRRRRKKVQVPIAGQTALRVANIEDGATMGATLGVDLFDEAGNVYTLASLAAALGVTSSSSSSSSLGSLAVTLWRLIREVPIYTESPVSPTWQYTLDGAPIGDVGFAAGANGIAAGSLLGDLVLAPVSGRVFLPDAVPLIAISSSADAIRAGAGVTDGYATLSRATGTTAPGYARFYDAAGVSRGYVGFHDSASRITLTAENGWGIKLSSAADNLIQATNTNRLIGTQLQIGQATTVPFLTMNGTTPYLAAGGSGAGDAFWMIQRYNAAGGGPDIAMYHSRGASVGTHTILQSGDEIGSISFYASDGTATPVKVARIIGFINGAVGGAGDLPSRIAILTTPDGSATSQTTAFFSPEESEFNSTLFDFNGAMDVQSTSGIVALQVSSGYLAVSGSSSSGTIAMLAQNALPRIGLLETDAAADNQLWYVYANAERFNIGAVNDARSVVTNAFFIDRTGTTIDLVRIDTTEFEVNATTIDFNGTMDVSLVLTVQGATGLGTVGIASGGDITVAKTSASLYLVDAAAAADEDVYRLANITGTLVLQTRTDANAAGATIMTVERTGTVVDSVVFATTLFQVSGTAYVSGNLGAGASSPGRALHVANSAAWIRLEETDAGVDEKIWLVGQSGGGTAAGFQILSRNDADSTGAQALQILRSGTTIAEIQLDATLFDFNGTLDVDGGAHDIDGSALQLGANTTITFAAREYVFNGEANDYQATVVNPMIYVSSGGGVGEFTGLGHMIFHTRTTAARDFIFRAGTTPANIVRFFGDGSEVEFNVTTFDMNGAIDVSGIANFGARVVSQNSFQALGSATNTGVNAIHAILDVNGGASRVISYNWSTAAVRPLEITGSTVTITSDATTTVVNNLAVTGVVTLVDFIRVSGAAPEFRIQETDGALNEQYWLWLYSGGTLTLRAYNDALNASSVGLSFDRTGTTIDLIAVSATEVELNGTTLDFNGNMDLSGAAVFSGSVTPAALAAGDNDNVNLGVGSVVRARISGNAVTSNLTSVTGGADGKLLILTNVSANEIMIINEDAGGTAANRFAINGDMALPQNCSAIFIYDGNISRWTRLN